MTAVKRAPQLQTIDLDLYDKAQNDCSVLTFS